MKALKYVAVAVAALLLIAIAVAVYLAATFDPNAYKPRLVELVKEKTGRTLTLDGDLALSFWPGVGAQVGRMSLSEPGSSKPFAAMESARVSVKLLPLLAREVVVDELTIRGLRADIVRTKSGATNVDDLLGKKTPKEEQPAAPQEPLAFDIAHVELDDAAVQYRDEATGAQYALSGFTLKTGRIAPDVPTDIRLTTAARSTEPALDVTIDAKTRLTFNLERQAYKAENLALDVRGRAAGITGLAAKASGSVSANLQSGEFGAERLTVSATGMRGKEKIEAKLDAPRLAMTTDKASGETVTVTFDITAPDRVTAIAARLAGLEGSGKSFRSAAMTLDLERKQPEQTLKARIASPLSGNVEAKQVSLPQLKATITASGPKLPGKSIGGELAGSASLDATRERAQLDLSGRLADSSVRARIGVAGYTPPGVDFDVELDQLDLERFTGAAEKPKSDGKAPAGVQKEEPFDLAALRELRANGTLRIGALKTSALKASDVRVALKAGGGRLTLDPLAASLYQGVLSGAASINAVPATPVFSVRQTLTGVAIGPMLRDLADTDALEGRGNISLDVTAQGSTVSALKKALGGSASVKMTDGAVKGIDVAGAIRKAQSMIGSLKGEQVQKSDARERTDFTELVATFDIRNGVARNDDLSIKSPLLRVGGAGAVDIGGGTLDYTVKATLVGTIEGQGGKARSDLRGLTVPIAVTGPLASPSYRIDFGAMVTDTARHRIEDAIKDRLQERLGGKAGADAAPKEAPKSREALEKTLKGIFGR